MAVQFACKLQRGVKDETNADFGIGYLNQVKFFFRTDFSFFEVIIQNYQAFLELTKDNLDILNFNSITKYS